jgi:hypothetical protein
MVGALSLLAAVIVGADTATPSPTAKTGTCADFGGVGSAHHQHAICCHASCGRHCGSRTCKMADADGSCCLSRLIPHGTCAEMVGASAKMGESMPPCGVKPMHLLTVDAITRRTKALTVQQRPAMVTQKDWMEAAAFAALEREQLVDGKKLELLHVVKGTRTPVKGVALWRMAFTDELTLLVKHPGAPAYYAQLVHATVLETEAMQHTYKLLAFKDISGDDRR